MLSKVSVLGEAVRKKSEKHRARTPERFSRDVFLTFSGTPHAKHLLSRRILDGRTPKLVSKVSDSYEAVQQRSKKHHARAPPRAKSDDPLSKNNDFGTRPGIPRIPGNPRKRWQQLRRRPPLTHAPGARMTVVTQTPSNYMGLFWLERKIAGLQDVPKGQKRFKSKSPGEIVFKPKPPGQSAIRVPRQRTRSG